MDRINKVNNNEKKDNEKPLSEINLYFRAICYSFQFSILLKLV